MANTKILEEVSRLLPPHEREQFLELIIQFSTVPDDDEYLQILQSIGYMTLLWKEVPKEIKAILEGANPVHETCHSIAKQIREAVIEAIPSYADLQQISQRLEQHEISLKRLLSHPPSSPPSQLKKGMLIPCFLAGLIAGFFLNSLIPTQW